jgi:hypothetical protein
VKRSRFVGIALMIEYRKGMNKFDGAKCEYAKEI